MCFQGMFKKNKTGEQSYFDRPANLQKKRDLQLLAFSLGLIAVTALLVTLLIVTHGFGLAALAVVGKGGVGYVGAAVLAHGTSATAAGTGGHVLAAKGLTLFAAKARAFTLPSDSVLSGAFFAALGFGMLAAVSFASLKDRCCNNAVEKTVPAKLTA